MSKSNRIFDFDGNKGTIVPVVLSIIFISSLLVGYYLLSNAPPEGFSSIYILDAQKKTESYPEFVIINENNTFNVNVGVKNHMGKKQSYEIQQKLTKDPILTFPINENPENIYFKTLESQEIWETLITTTINNPGNYSLVFELYLKDDAELVDENTKPVNYVLLNIEVDVRN